MTEPSAADIVEAQDATQPLEANPTSFHHDSTQSNALTRSSGRDADLSEGDQLLADAGWTSVKSKKGSKRSYAATGKAAQASGAGRKVFINTLGKLFDRLPAEVIEAVLESIFPEWQRMPTAFLLSHVCSGWRALVRSMPSLWGDHCSLLPPANITRRATSRRVPQIYRFLSTQSASSCQLAWLRHCAKLSHDSAKHFEMEVWDWQGEEDEVLGTLLAYIEKSLHRLESLSFVTRKTTGTMRSPGSRSGPGDFIGLDLAMRSPKATEAHFYFSITTFEDAVRVAEKKALAWVPGLPFRRLILECAGELPRPDGTPAQQVLQRCRQLRSLVLRNVSGVGSWHAPPLGRERLPFVLALLATCFPTLVDLDTSGCVSLLAELKRSGEVNTWPELRNFRCAPVEDDGGRVYYSGLTGDLTGMTFPRLETIEAPSAVMTAFPCAPSGITLRLDDESKCTEECKAFIEWLRNLEDSDGRRIQSLTLLLASTGRENAIDCLIKALTPSSNAEAPILCPQLTKLKIVVKPPGRNPQLNSLPSLPTLPLSWGREYRDPALLDVARLLAMDDERRRLSQGLPLVDAKDRRRQAKSRGGTSKKRGPETVAAQDIAEGASIWPVCKALTSIEIVGCDITAAERSRLRKRSSCKVDVKP